MANAVVGMEFWANFPYVRGGGDKVGSVHGIVTVDDGYKMYRGGYRHYIYFLVLWSEHPEFVIGREYVKIGNRFYKHIYDYRYPPDYADRERKKAMRKRELFSLRWA